MLQFRNAEKQYSQAFGYECVTENYFSLNEYITENYFSYLSTKTFVVGTQKNRLSETVLLSTLNKCLKWRLRNYLQFYAQIFCLSKPVYSPVQLELKTSYEKEKRKTRVNEGQTI